jgi:3-oxoacyl-[acyl-carrier protein] reductase
MSHAKEAVGSSAAETEESTSATPATSIPEPLDNTSDQLPGIHEKRKSARESGLRNKVVVVTGAGAGIGRATAMRFAEEGARIAAWDVSPKAATQLESAIRWAGGEGCFQAVNVTSADEVQSAAEEVLDRWQRIDVLINNAGIVRDAQLVKWNGNGPESMMSEENWDAVINVNLKGVFLTTRAVVPQMIRQRSGVILCAASVVGLLGNFGQTNYVASKAGVIGMTRTWARELGRYNIRVNAVAPGFIATEMVRAMPEKVLHSMIARTPLGRAGTPEDVANTYVWLASDQASFIHGTVISVDGGVVIGT